MKSKIVLGLSVFCQFTAKLWTMVLIVLHCTLYYIVGKSNFIPIDLTSGLLLLVLPIPIGWAATLLLHKLMKTKFWLLSTKDKLIHLLSTTWFTVPTRRMGDRDQRHKETFFALLLAGLNIVGTLAALLQLKNPRWFHRNSLQVFFPSLFFYLAGCGFLLLFEKTVHPWRHLGKERESHCWGKLQGTKAEQTFWDQVSLS